MFALAVNPALFVPLFFLTLFANTSLPAFAVSIMLPSGVIVNFTSVTPDLSIEIFSPGSASPRSVSLSLMTAVIFTFEAPFISGT